MKTHGIIGGGLSGTLTAIRLLRDIKNPITIHLFEKDATKMFRGEAYSSSLSHQLLNVTAGQMSVFEEHPTHFSDWLFQNQYPYLPGDFVPRSIYGDYLTECLKEASMNAPQHIFYTHNKEIVDLEISKSYVQVITEYDQSIRCTDLWLCTGNLAPSHLPVFAALKQSPNYISNPWSGKDNLSLKKKAKIVILGSGLSMVDQVLSLFNSGHQGKISVISRKGLLPHYHMQVKSFPLTNIPDFKKMHLLELLKWIRSLVNEAEKQDYNWRSVIKSLREHTPNIWQSLSARDKEVFIHRLSTFWNIHRHQIPQRSYEQLKDLQSYGQLVVCAGKIEQAVETKKGIKIRYKEKFTANQNELFANKVINCTGPSTYKNIASPLYKNLLHKNMISVDEQGLGIQPIQTTSSLSSQVNLHIIGPPAKGKFWECTALREIRKQTRELIKSENYA